MSYFCKHLPTEVIELDGITYWAMDADGADYFRGDLVINLTTTENISGAMKIPELSSHFEVSYDELQIPWRDGGIPNVKMSFWNAIHEYSLKRGYKHVGVHCFAGHGRTGTMLASLMIVIGGWDAKQAVDYLRENYCDKVVESEIQCLHLQELDWFMNDNEPDEENEIKPSMSYRKVNRGNWSGHWLD